LWNSVLGAATNAGTYLAYGYDPGNERLVVGNPTQNTVTLLVRDQLFADGFD
jgi:hypothetical protein